MKTLYMLKHVKMIGCVLVIYFYIYIYIYILICHISFSLNVQFNEYLNLKYPIFYKTKRLPKYKKKSLNILILAKKNFKF